MLRTAGRGLLQVLLPPLCPLCREHSLPSGRTFCPACVGRVTPAREPWCPTCALPYPGAGPSHVCPRCRDEPPPFERVRVWGEYAGGLAEAIQRFKYASEVTLRRAMEQLIVAAFRQHYGTLHVSTIVPVPPHGASLRRRGSDLAALLAWHAGRAGRIPVRLRALRKVVRTPDLVTLDAAERRRAVALAFAPAEALQGAVLLVDDVVTTTATARACSAACRAAGAESVSVLALARTGTVPRRN